MNAAAKRLNTMPEIDTSLPTCPFCGASAQVQFWHGGRPSKRMISCSGVDCEVSPNVSGETLREARQHWSRRVPTS